MQILFDFFRPITSTQNKNNKPLSSSLVLVVALAVIVVLSLVAGYYHAKYLEEKKRYLRLEDMFVRVRSQIGREAMQDLIDASYQPITEPILDVSER
jgi:hypothetical protein